MYYAYIPIIFIVLFFGLFVLIKDHFSLASKAFFILSLSFSLWTLNEIIQWIATPVAIVHFAWEMATLLQAAVFLTSAYFLYIFSTKKDVPFLLKIIFTILVVPIFILTPTKLNYTGFDLTNCESVFGPLSQYLYVLNLTIFILLLLFLYHQWKVNKKNPERKGQSKVLILGTFLFLGMFIVTSLLGDATLVYEFNLFGPLGTAAFIATMSFLIVRYKAFNFNLIGAQALVAALLIITGSILFIRTIENVRIVLIPSLVIMLLMSYFLVRSVKHEVEQREKLQTLTTELAIANEKLKELDKLKDEFLSFASHDLKSPVAKMKQWASLVYDGTYAEPAQIKETAFKIKMTGDRAIRLVDEFLNIRKIEEGKMEYNFEQKDVVSFVQGITNDFAPIAKQKNLELNFNTSSPELQVSFDTLKFRQVIENLIDNSLKYTETGFINVTVTEEQKSVLISIKDSGGGMDPDIIPTLFEQFRREAGVAKKIAGTGLGLYIAKQIMLAHHGEIWAESEGRGKGSTFYVRLAKA